MILIQTMAILNKESSISFKDAIVPSNDANDSHFPSFVVVFVVLAYFFFHFHGWHISFKHMTWHV